MRDNHGPWSHLGPPLAIWGLVLALALPHEPPALRFGAVSPLFVTFPFTINHLRATSARSASRGGDTSGRRGAPLPASPLAAAALRRWRRPRPRERRRRRRHEAGREDPAAGGG